MRARRIIENRIDVCRGLTGPPLRLLMHRVDPRAIYGGVGTDVGNVSRIERLRRIRSAESVSCSVHGFCIITK